MNHIDIDELEQADRRAGDGGVLVAALAASLSTLLVAGVIARFLL